MARKSLAARARLRAAVAASHVPLEGVNPATCAHVEGQVPGAREIVCVLCGAVLDLARPLRLKAGKPELTGSELVVRAALAGWTAAHSPHAGRLTAAELTRLARAQPWTVEEARRVVGERGTAELVAVVRAYGERA